MSEQQFVVLGGVWNSLSIMSYSFGLFIGKMVPNLSTSLGHTKLPLKPQIIVFTCLYIWIRYVFLSKLKSCWCFTLDSTRLAVSPAATKILNTSVIEHLNSTNDVNFM